MLALLKRGPPPFAKQNLCFFQKMLHSSCQTMSAQSLLQSCCVFCKSKSMSSLKCLFRLHQTTFFTPRRSHPLKIALQKTLSFSTFALQTSTLYCNLHIKLDVKFCAQARLFLKVAKPSEASLPNCVFTTFRPFKNAVRYDNSGFWACAFS